MKKISWRDVFDCKRTGEHVEDTARKAAAARYKLFCHNGNLYAVTADGAPAETGLTEEHIGDSDG